MQKDIEMDVNGRQRDVQITIDGRDHGEFTFTIATGGGGHKEVYEGPYTLRSEADEMDMFPTRNKVMTENLVLLPIAYSETTNLKGGLTVCIGGN